ncbi:MAG TPA: SBBP repeat-containing protein [Myxococcota bacterium]|nr:SBBP repeat-containing protein [Myxococcota bacterium]
MNRTIDHFSRRLSLLVRGSALLLLLLGFGAARASAVELPAAAKDRPLAFEENRGQTDSRVRFVARSAGYTVFLTPTEAVLSLRGRENAGAVVRVKPVGASPTARLVPDDALPGVVNYAPLPAAEPLRVSAYARVRYAGVYPGVDLVYYGRPRALEYDFVVAPGADPDRIALALEGAERLELDAEGELVVHTAAGELRQPRPVAYQEIDGARRTVSASYVVDGNGRVRLQLGGYDRSRTLVIDPVLAYATYLGGSNEEMDWLFGPAFGIAVDGAGNTYVTGTTSSVDFPTTPGASGALGGEDAFVTKFSPTGTVLYSTYLGGPCDDIANAIAVDGAGNAYVTGRAHGGVCMVGLTSGALVAKLGPTGGLVYALVFGGALVDTSMGRAIAIDAQGRAYVTGTTSSSDFPVTGGIRNTPCATAIDPTYTDGFVARLSAAGVLSYSTFLCGDGFDQPNGIALDAGGNVYVAGWTASGDFPTVNPFQATSKTYPFGITGFVSKLAADGSHLVYSTYLGGSINDYVNGLAVDGQGNAYVAGKTESTDYPTTPGVLQPQRGNVICIDQFCTDAFVTKINAAGNALVYSTYLSGEGDDGATKIAVDGGGNAYVIGSTSSLFFPIRDAFEATCRVRGPSDAFVAKLSPDATHLLYSSYFGGSGGASPLTGDDEGSAIAIDAAGNAYVAGFTKSYDLPTTPGAFQPTIGGGTCDYFGGPCGDAFVAKIGAGGPGVVAPTRVGVAPADVAPGARVNATWAIPNPTPTDALLLFALGAGSDSYVTWWTTGGAAAGTLALQLPADLPFGNYEIRLMTPDPNYGGLLEAVARTQPIHVGPAGGSCGLVGIEAFPFLLGAAWARRRVGAARSRGDTRE